MDVSYSSLIETVRTGEMSVELRYRPHAVNTPVKSCFSFEYYTTFRIELQYPIDRIGYVLGTSYLYNHIRSAHSSIVQALIVECFVCLTRRLVHYALLGL
jgi:hypothetical protein